MTTRPTDSHPTAKQRRLIAAGFVPRNLPAILRLRAERAAKRAQAVRS